MHVHDAETSVLEVGLWDRGEEGAIPLSMTDVFRGEAGKELVGTARVPLSKVRVWNGLVGWLCVCLQCVYLCVFFFM